MLEKNIALILYVMLGAIVGMLYSLRRVIMLDRRIIDMEKSIITLDKNIIKLLKKRRR